MKLTKSCIPCLAFSQFEVAFICLFWQDNYKDYDFENRLSVRVNNAMKQLKRGSGTTIWFCPVRRSKNTKRMISWKLFMVFLTCTVVVQLQLLHILTVVVDLNVRQSSHWAPQIHTTMIKMNLCNLFFFLFFSVWCKCLKLVDLVNQNVLHSGSIHCATDELEIIIVITAVISVSAISCQHGWVHHALWVQQKCMQKTYEKYYINVVLSALSFQ